MNYIVSAETDIGIFKNTNQDSLSVKIINTPAGRTAFAILCDGMGGLSKGETASASVIKAFDAWVLNALSGVCNSGFDENTLKTQWEEILQNMNSRIKSYGAKQSV